MAEIPEDKPWHNCPSCPKCKLACVVQGFGGGLHLFCPACGHRFHGTDSEREQARVADEAWAAQEAIEYGDPARKFPAAEETR